MINLQEREEFHRLKMVKAKKNFSQSLMKSNKKPICGGSGESGKFKFNISIIVL